MGWFGKKEKREIKNFSPPIPELPKLPELPPRNSEENEIHQLPRLPNNSFGEKFSQNMIKESVAGKKEENGGLNVNDFNFQEQENKKIQEPLEESKINKIPFQGEKNNFLKKEIPKGFKEIERKVKETEPIFIRLDKFEESLNIVEKTKKQITEIEGMLRDIKKTKEKEEEELNFWENEVQEIKKQIENVNKKLFSKLD